NLQDIYWVDMDIHIVSTILESGIRKKLISLLLITFIIMCTACSPAVPEVTPMPTSTETPNSTSTARPSSTSTLTATFTETLTPSVTYTPTETKTASPTNTITLTSTSTPTGPAKVVATLPESTSCTFKGSPPTCTYYYTITYTESRGIGATITWIKLVYFDSEGYAWCKGRCEWDVNTRIEGNSSTTDEHHIEGIIDAIGLPDRDFKGGRVEINYKGTDDNGYDFSGYLVSKFVKP
ncbi:MAG: hypothetical protein MUO40_01525, partial [Anaerolineaceae bacterium]|nr:hypothetical protein [Anaerolineaceae bacterium]